MFRARFTTPAGTELFTPAFTMPEGAAEYAHTVVCADPQNTPLELADGRLVQAVAADFDAGYLIVGV